MGSDWLDIGDGHQIKFATYKDDPHAGMNDRHVRPDGTECVGFITFEGSAWAKEFEGGKIAVWQVQSWEPLTISPSLLCRVCGDHGFIRGGKWVRA